MPVQPVLEKAGGLSAPRLLGFAKAYRAQLYLDLARLRDEQVDMFTTVFIGAATTQAVAGRMVTPRGYEAKR